MKKKPLQLLIMLSKNLLWGMMIQTFCFSLILAAPGNAQKIQSVREVEISLSKSNFSITGILKQIEYQTDFKFFYDKRFVNKELNISFNRRRLKVADVLMEISRRSNLKFKQVNNTINISINKEAYDPDEVMEVIIQGKSVSGNVTSFEDGEPLPGVNVVEKGSTNGTVTNVEGEYNLTVSEGATLVFSSVGYTSEEIEIGSRSVIDLAMTQDIQQLQELVVVGYGTVNKSDLTSAISRVDGEDLRARISTRVDQELQGQMSGVSVQQTSGVPGNAPFVRIRGAASINSANGPLYVIDGFPIEDP